MGVMGGRGRSCCFPREVMGVYVGLAFVNGVIALLAFSQLIKIHTRRSRSGWTRQEVFHLLIGSSNIVYSIYFVLAIIASCQNWLYWSYGCGFIIMALPKILSFAAFLMLLSFWVDLCHQADDEDYEEEDLCFHEALLEVVPNNRNPVHADGHRSCFRFCSIHVGSRQKIVILVTLLFFFVMIAFAVLMWNRMGSDVIDSLWLARVYVCLFATAMLLLGGALACYGFLLCSKMRRVRSDRATFEMQKVAGSSLPSAFVLLIMRDLPPVMPSNVREESAIITFTNDTSAATQNTERWITVTSLQNQISRGSPI